MGGDQKGRDHRKKKHRFGNNMDRANASVGLWSMGYIDARHNRSFCLVLERRTAHVPFRKDY